MKTCSKCGVLLYSDPYRDSTRPEEENVQNLKKDFISKETKQSIKTSATDILVGVFFIAKCVTLALLLTIIPHFLGRWFLFHVAGWDSPVDWNLSPAPIVNWATGMTLLFWWKFFRFVGREVRKS